MSSSRSQQGQTPRPPSQYGEQNHATLQGGGSAVLESDDSLEVEIEPDLDLVSPSMT
jgi:hypothetical protein